jgi:hypothetical protein
MLLVIERPEEKRALTQAEGKRRYDRMMDFAAGLKSRGALIAGESLGSDANGTRITKRDGQRSVVDGPFTEAKEILGGFFLLDIDSRKEGKSQRNARRQSGQRSNCDRSVAAGIEGYRRPDQRLSGDR